jgi:hypothetical protein
MKKVLVFILFVILSSVVFAQTPGEENNPVKTDGWVKRSVLGVEPFNIGNTEIAVPFNKCDAKWKNCARAGIVTQKLDEEKMSLLSWHIYEKLINSRYNKITAGGDIITVTAGDISFSLESAGFPVFDPSVSGNFRNKLENYSSSVQKVLQTTVNELFHGMSDSQKTEYIARKAEETGLDPKFIPVFMNLSYIFGIDIKSVTAEGIIVPVELNDHKGSLISGFQVGFDIDIKADLHVYRYDAGKNSFVYEKRIKINSKDYLARQLGLGGSGSDAEFFTEMPVLDSDAVNEIWNRSLTTALSDLGTMGSYKLRKDPAFSSHIPVKEVDGSSITGKGGFAEDIRVDQPFSIIEQKDGNVISTGYAKARKVGNNCSDKTETTSFRRIMGDAAQGDKLEEVPWSGVMLTFGGGINQFRVNFYEYQGSKNLEKLGGIMGGNQLGMSLNLGYLSNLRFFSETWLSFGGSFIFAHRGITGLYKAPMFAGGYLGLSHRIHLTAGGAFFAPMFKFNAVGGGAERSQYNEREGDLFFGAFLLEPALQLGFSFTPSIEMILQGGYHFPVGGKIYKGEERIPDNQATFKPGVTASLIFQIHLPFRGGAASAAYSKPSRECRGMMTEDHPYCKARPLPETLKEKKEEEKPAPVEEKQKKKPAKETESLVPPPFDPGEIGVIDMLNVDTAIIVAYDSAVKSEKREDILENSQDAVEAWKSLAEIEENNPFLEFAKKRLALWKRYHDAKEAEIKAKQTALENIGKIIALSSITEEQKVHVVVQYLKQYGPVYGTSDIMQTLADSADQETAMKILNAPDFDKELKNVLSSRCEEGDGESCHTYGMTFPEESEERKSFLEKACELDHSDSCRILKGEDAEEAAEETSEEPKLLMDYGY